MVGTAGLGSILCSWRKAHTRSDEVTEARDKLMHILIGPGTNGLEIMGF